MSPELEDKLAERFAFMRYREDTNKNGFIDDLYTAFGCEFGDGWYELIWNLCIEIEKEYIQYPNAPELIIIQAKEKFGGLRLYVSFKDNPVSIHAIDILGQGTIRAKKPDVNDKEFCNRIYDIIDKYEIKSETVCEVCGKDGEIRNTTGWIQTRCNECEENFMKELNERIAKIKNENS